MILRKNLLSQLVVAAGVFTALSLLAYPVASDSSPDEPPQISFPSLDESNTVVVPENEPPGRFVALIQVDSHSGEDHANCDCILEDAVDFTIRQITTSHYKLETSRSLDRERHNRYLMRVSCQRINSQTSVRGHAELTVVVDDVNDHQPIFETAYVQAMVIENAPVGTEVARVLAVDPDAGANGQITYGIIQSQDSLAIDPESGLIRTVGVLDRERHDQIAVRVFARDNGFPALTSTATVRIHVLDVDDNVPIFTHPRYSFIVSENNMPESRVGQITAVDIDSPTHNRIAYSIRGPSPSNFPFSIDDTGAISTQRTVDREATPSFHFTVLACSGQVPHCNTADVSVQVSDVNDNRPIFLFPTPQNNTMHIRNIAPGEVFATISAIDPDEGRNGQISYELFKNGDETIQQYFQVNRYSGEVAATSEQIPPASCYCF